MTIHSPSLVQTPALSAPAAPTPAPGFSLFGQDGVSFRDLLDVINPLHHIPVVGNIYRNLTGDGIKPAFRIAGGALFGGALGAAFAAATVVMQQVRGDGVPLTPVPPVADPPGGWMVAATRKPPSLPHTLPSAPQLAEQNSPPGRAPRRGGWMVQAAYAMADAERVDMTAIKTAA